MQDFPSFMKSPKNRNGAKVNSGRCERLIGWVAAAGLCLPGREMSEVEAASGKGVAFLVRVCVGSMK